ncbi:type II toxin-antitoxin system VapC family toxin [bacterium]|nr:type II toxin-antitoxin system VapC family toxin [bacterium]
MNVVDSSGWLEYFSDSAHADKFAEPLTDLDNLLVPTICVYEVFKVVLREKSEDEALQAIATMKQGQIVDLTFEIAIQAALVNQKYKIPMADSIIYATTKMFKAVLWTMDKDFEKFKSVKYFPRLNKKA